ncbi:hypothetical protein [Mucilaginibacter sp. L3T2-6]|uniref:hypothetical protein n=1 Tax=Mucilaginibacter sp. L3T2-6 TaxID=3062491 RepID=UPI00267650BE|nr:hypothetical protein [Mucilaginibacter sp. L3T2-6]MDO3641310.1 hypothetical protein [Mucilaginibacter sp. L3T2-6]MDV6213930.1 hypothetical protein [Mucilaginibacter sp. L3T2-6]
MNSLQLFNLHWLCYAMTAPGNGGARYYYDGQAQKFFCTKPVAGREEPEFFNMVDLKVDVVESFALSEKLRIMEGESSFIVEIPRLQVSDKISVQLMFLSRFPGIVHEDDIRLVVEKQADAHGFVLDKMFAKNSALNPMEPYWEEFKFKTIQYYLEIYTGLQGIALKLIG